MAGLKPAKRNRQIRVRMLHRLGASNFWIGMMRVTRGWQRRGLRPRPLGLLLQSR